MQFFAHSTSEATSAGWHLLSEHLREVANLARRFAEAAMPSFAMAPAAYLAGLWHDLGKYRPEFQQMLRGLHPRNERAWHKQAGAARQAITKC